MYDELTKALIDNDYKLARRLAHTLKGNAGIFQKHNLYNTVNVVEQHISNEASFVTDEHLNSLKTELDKVLKELKPLFEQN